MKQKLFVDMDGTLNEWSTTATMHEVCQPGYFTQRLAQRIELPRLSLKPETWIRESLLSSRPR